MSRPAPVTVYFVLAQQLPGGCRAWPGTAPGWARALRLLAAAQSAEPRLDWHIYSLTALPSSGP